MSAAIDPAGLLIEAALPGRGDLAEIRRKVDERRTRLPLVPRLGVAVIEQALSLRLRAAADPRAAVARWPSSPIPPIRDFARLIRSLAIAFAHEESRA